ncbi:restriction endonuclease subunit S [Anabaena sp. 4-3]|uniref:restriction endonuclease subunit S n=1 Tax=Anabaena sp. 4-3 TaxID=1811979 RepID=UPI00082C76A8|nr:restriction endonuclease subunit S [Anabaena sp. 4-3]
MGVVKALVKLSALSSNSNLRVCFSKEAPKTSRKLVKLLDCLSLVEAGSRPKGGIVYIEDEEVAISLGGEQIGKDGRIDLTNMPVVPLYYYNSTNKGKVRQKDILVCKDGALTGKCCLVNQTFPINEVMVNEHVYIFRSNETYLHDFLFYLFRDEFTQFQIKDLAYRKKGQPGLNTDHLSLIRLPYFYLSEQKQILNIINRIEKEINVIENSKLQPLNIINQVFGDYFKIDLDEVYKLEKAKILPASFSQVALYNPALRSGLRWNKMQYIQSILYSDIDCIQTLGRFIKSTKNGWSPLSVEGGEGIPVLGQENYSFDGILKIEPSKFTEENRNNIEEFYIEKGDFFVSRGNTVDLVGLASIVNDEIEENIIFPDLYIRVELDETFIDKQYLSYIFNSFIGRLYFKYVAKGKNQTMVKVSSTELLNFRLPIPEFEEQIEIVEAIKTQLDSQKEIDRQIEEKQQTINKIIEDAIRHEQIDA